MPHTTQEPGHKRKYLIVVDETAECERAVFYAAHRATKTHRDVVMLAITPPPDPQAWMGLDAKMRDEEIAKATTLMDKLSHYCETMAHITPQRIILEGDRAQAIVSVIKQDPDIAVLVLAASTSNEGPGPLVSHFVLRMAGTFPIPILIVPGNLSDAELKSII